MTEYKTPGVYVQEINSLPKAISGVATAVPVFIGYTQATDSDLHEKGTRINSFLEYTNLFGVAPALELNFEVTHVETDENNIELGVELEAATGNFLVPKNNMFYAMQMFFANGGGACYIYSLGHSDDIASTPLTAPYTDALNELKKYDEPTLIVFPDAPSIFEADTSKYNTIVEAALGHCALMKDRFLIADVQNAHNDRADELTTSEIDTLVLNYRENIGLSPTDVRYGASYFPYLRSSLTFNWTEASIKITDHDVSKSDDAEATYTVVTEDISTSPDPATLESIKNTHKDVYFAIKNIVDSYRVIIPPSPAMAGIYADTDAKRGVWKAPANVGVKSVINPEIQISDDLNGRLNVHSSGKSINAIRTFTGRGNLVWGARTLDANDLNWRFVNVRREVLFIEESIKKALENYVFEPNTANTWVKVKTMISAFLTTIWKAGGLSGERAEDAFEVNIGINMTMTPIEVAEGKMIVEVKLVPPRPAEIIILRVAQKLQSS